MMYGRGYGYGYGDMMGGGWLYDLMMLLFAALIVAGIVLLIVWAVRSSSGRGAAGRPASHETAPGHDEAVGIAKRRLASGEITAQEYEEILRALGG